MPGSSRRHSLSPNLEPLEGRSLTAVLGPRAVFGGGSFGPAYLVVCEGNSLTAGRGASDPPTQNYPAQLQARLGSMAKVLNFGISGLTTVKMVAHEKVVRDKVSQLLPLLPNTIHHWAVDVLWEGTNSLRITQDAVSSVRKMAQLVALRHAQQFKVVVLTVPPADNLDQVPDTFETQRKIYNALIRKNVVRADLVVDVAGDSRLADPDSNYYARDHFHMSEKGYAVVSALVAQAVVRIQKLPPPS